MNKYVTELRILAGSCEVGNLNKPPTRDRILCGVKCEVIHLKKVVENGCYPAKKLLTFAGHWNQTLGQAEEAGHVLKVKQKTKQKITSRKKSTHYSKSVEIGSMQEKIHSPHQNLP